MAWPDMDHRNVYEDAQRADAYAALGFPGTYFLAYRDLPEIISWYVIGDKAVDIGCGTGRSTRFLQRLGFDAVGVDIATKMIEKARHIDPDGDYRLIDEGGAEAIPGEYLRSCAGYLYLRQRPDDGIEDQVVYRN